MTDGALKANAYITEETLEWATKPDCPALFNGYLASILLNVLHYEGAADKLWKVDDKYSLSWWGPEGDEYLSKVFTKEQILTLLKTKIITYSLDVIQKGR